MESNFLAWDNQVLQRARWGRPFHTEKRGGDGIKVRLLPVVLRHAGRGIDGGGILELRLNVRDQIVGNLGGAEFQFRGVLTAESAQIRTEILLRIQTLDDVAACATFLQEEAVAQLNFLLRWRLKLGDIAEQVGVDQFGGDVLRDFVKILVGPAVSRHARVRQIGFGVTQPSDQPIRIHLATDFGEFRADVATDQFRFARASDRQGMAGRAKHLPEAQLAL